MLLGEVYLLLVRSFGHPLGVTGIVYAGEISWQLGGVNEKWMVQSGDGDGGVGFWEYYWYAEEGARTISHTYLPLPRGRIESERLIVCVKSTSFVCRWLHGGPGRGKSKRVARLEREIPIKV